MKNFFKAIGGCALALVLFTGGFTGCAVVHPPATPMTPEQRTDKLALVLKNMVSDVVILAINDKNPDARAKIVKAREALAIVASSTNASPRDIMQSIAPLLEDAKPEVRVAANTVVGVLEALWGDYVIDVTGGNENALKFLRAVVAGIDAGLSLSPK